AAVDADQLSIWIAGPEELLAHRLADQAHARAAARFLLGEGAARGQRPVAGLQKGAVRARYRSAHAFRAVDDAHLLLGSCGDGARPGEAHRKRIELLGPEPAPLAPVRAARAAGTGRAAR